MTDATYASPVHRWMTLDPIARLVQLRDRWRVAAGSLLVASAMVGGCSDNQSSAGSDTDGDESGQSTSGTASDDSTPEGSTSADSTDDDGSIDESLDPGRVTLHRLNATEYTNTLRDLFFGLETDPARDFPPDPRAIGFDNIAEVLTLSPVQFALYERAADEVLNAAFLDPANGAVRDQLWPCDIQDDSCMADVVGSFAERAWRRPLSDEERQALEAEVGFAEAEGATRAVGIRSAFKRSLLSIHFLFRVEIDLEPESAEPHLVTDFELATRLSYFLWSSMPDEELFGLARSGDLQSAEVIDEQVRRMLADPRAEALLDNFVGQWLSVRGVRELTKEASVFPEFDSALAGDMATETEMFVRSFFEDDRPLSELLTSDETFANARLAAHYGIEGPTGDGFERVSLAGAPRKGLLTQAGLMSILAHEDKTAPTVRGAWVLGQLMCAPPPAPPADIPDLEESGGPGSTARERLEEHRRNPACASCHAQMDPIGLAFENYDAVGGHRLKEGDANIDASGELNGSTFGDALELAQLLADDEATLSACVAKHLLTYALGREIDGSDDDGHINAAVETFAAADHRLPELVLAVAQSGAFRRRRGEPE